MMTQGELAQLGREYAKNGGDLLRKFGFIRPESAAQCIISLYAAFQKSIGGNCGAFDYFEKVCGENASAKVQSVKETAERAKQQISGDMLVKCEENQEAVKAIILFFELGVRDREIKNAVTPELCSLIGKILAPGAKKVTNIGMGRAGFIRDSFAEFEEDTERFGSEEDPADYLCSLIRAEIMEIPFENFSCRSLLEETEKSDRFFTLLPFGYCKAVELPANSVAESFAKCNPELFNERLPEWFYAAYLADKLNYNGKGALLAAPSLLYRTSTVSVQARRNMLENGRIAAVIQIDNRRLYKNTAINACIVLLGKNCQSVRFVYAQMRENYETDTLTKDEIESIVKAYNNIEASLEFGELQSMTKTVDELLDDKNKNCSLEPRYYVMAEEQSGMKTLTDYLPQDRQTGKTRSIFRSRIFSSKDINGYFTDEATPCKYLEIANLENGTIGGKIQNMTEIPEEQRIYLVKEGDILISRAATPNYKIAVAEFGENAPFKEGDEVLPGSNLYVIRVDTSRATPYFIKAWLESDKGQKALNNISACGVLSTLRVDRLKELCVPDATLEEQIEFTEKYKTFSEEIRQAKCQLDAKKEQLRNYTEEFFAAQK